MASDARISDLRDYIANAEPEHIRARVAYLYFVAGQTQRDIADSLGITRLRVNGIVGQCRIDGSVRVDVHIPIAECVALEERLKARFGLGQATVVPTIDDNDVLQRMIGEAAGALLDRLIGNGMGLGVGWGRTLSWATNRLTRRRHAESWVATLMGGLTRGSGTNTFEVATHFAQALGADCHYLAAPLYCPSVESREMLLTHDGLADVMRRARSVDIALVSSGDFSRRSQLAVTPVVRENLAGLRARGAIGDLLGSFLTAQGELADHPLNERIMALNIRDLARIRTSILVSGGLYKFDIVRAALVSARVNGIVTDEALARAILEKS
jgi:DNA-binding transcriptional regulator LsrR (DeoR family)